MKKTFEQLIKDLGGPTEAQRRSSVPKTTIIRIMGHKRNPTLKTLKELSDGLGIPMDDLVESLKPEVAN